MTEGPLGNRIRRFVGRLEKEDVNMHGFILTVDGEEKAAVYYAPFTEGQPHRMYSVSKTMTGIAVGMLTDDGRIRLDQPIADFFPDWLPPRPDKKLMSLTVADMLRMATCYRATAYREGADENWARAFFTGKPDHAPGTVFNYDTGCSQVLAALVRRVSGTEVIDLLEERLFRPLGAEDERYWLRDPSGCCQGGTGLCMSLRDLHRVSLCILDGGRGLIPGWYARKMGEKHIDTLLQANEEEKYGYGWQCWRTRAGFSMYGLGGQLSVLCPEKRAVLSTIADTRLDPCGVQRIYDAFFEEIYPRLGKEDTAPVVLRPKTVGLEDDGSLSLPEGGEYLFPGPNALGITAVRFGPGKAVFVREEGEAEMAFERGETLMTRWPGKDVPALVSAGMAAPGLLRVRYFAVGDSPCGFDMLLCFRGDTLTVQSRRSYDLVLTKDMEGVATGYKGPAPQACGPAD